MTKQEYIQRIYTFMVADQAEAVGITPEQFDKDLRDCCPWSVIEETLGRAFEHEPKASNGELARLLEADPSDELENDFPYLNFAIEYILNYGSGA